MTTQNTHHEHSDADASFVEHQSAPDNTVAPSTFETVPSEGTVIQTDIPAADELATAVELQVEATQETPTLSEASSIQKEEQQDTVKQEDQPQATSDPEATTMNETIPDYSNTIVSEEIISVSGSDEVSPSKEKEDEIRPFTDFIEEFRLAEEARLNASRQEIQTESFGLASADAETVPDETMHPITSMGAVLVESATNNVELHSDADLTTVAQQELVEEPVKEPSAPPPVVERAVSPLLRPATRLRVPRHGGRHIREDANAEKAGISATPAPAATDVETPLAASATAPSEQVTSPTEVPTEQEQPRPARRYRFDRPASTTNGTTGAAPVQPPVPQRVEENKEKDVQNHGTQVRLETALTGNDQQADGATTMRPAASAAKTEASALSPSIEPAQKQVQESASTESPSAPATGERGRRRQGSERQKEQPVAMSTPDAPLSPAEPVTTPGEIAPEDLPPLEYAELQKASTRRRRRHRPGTSSPSTTVAAAMETPAVVQPPVQPAPVVTPAPIVPPPLPLPTAPRPAATTEANGNGNSNSNQYTIVSGYTVSQMNQGNEVAGPFMGPEPSPARGSVITRDGRTVRAESQRSPIYPPVRTHEAGPSSASMNHFATAISQAIQTQTDRMVAEMRRNSQAPTNVSVTLPPFPSTERVGVFVDVANLLYSARTLRIAVDFGKLLDFLRGNRRLIRAHAYCPTSPQAGDEQMFLQAVKGLGYRITTKNYKTFSSGAKKADLDLDLCMDVVRIVDGGAVDCIVLVSGDSDFMPMLDYCSDHGVRVEVAAFDEAMSATLRQSCDLFINLSMLEEIRS
ncbi:MAG: NYN domain-containing protein [Ktedonobacteraceae bacterium]|nr:NYN domain-containing protein [Ktedonobacteraceae bacterium]